MKTYKKPLIIVVITIVLTFPIFIIGGLNISDSKMLYGIIEISCSLILFILGILLAAEIDRCSGYFKCKHCYKKFTPEIKKYHMAMHSPCKRRLKCPHCGKKSWCEHIIDD